VVVVVVVEVEVEVEVAGGLALQKGARRAELYH
jgi:hypothetical protein